MFFSKLRLISIVVDAVKDILYIDNNLLEYKLLGLELWQRVRLLSVLMSFAIVENVRVTVKTSIEKYTFSALVL